MEKWDIHSPVFSTGGDALNVAATLAKLGMPVEIIGRVGKDQNGDTLIHIGNEKGIDTSRVIRDEKYGTAVSYLLIDEDGERHSLSDADIYAAMCGSDVPDLSIRKADIVYFGSAFLMEQMDAGGTLDIFQRTHALGKITALDTSLDDKKTVGSETLQELKETLLETDIFIPSLSEAKLLTQVGDPIEMAKIMKSFNFKIFGVKLGSKGCFITDFKNSYTVGAFQEFQVKDTTGAGDSFMGAFLYGQAMKWDLVESCIFANAVAGHNVTAVGATSGVPDLKSVQRFLETNREKISVIQHE